ncbi:superinfection immunity protein [Colwellia piezophila]|uniref:superinfection immunity protein n=1 Tax=Colwellia piezophila TaxID=211668 RepID=UPI00037D803E|nr:superinfection immunity protein [Colwellia piezophila]
MEIILIIVLVVFALWVYFIPAIVASKRNHRNAKAILILNLCLGWMFLGWVGALVWAFMNDND